LDCATGVTGVFENYEHDKEPKDFTGYVKRWMEINDEIRRVREGRSNNNF